MFKNIGKKIKIVAVIWFALSTISSIFGSIMLCENLDADFVVLMFLCFFIIAIGVLVAWIGAIFVYGFGHLIDNSDKIANTLRHSENSKVVYAEDSFTPLKEFNDFENNN